MNNLKIGVDIARKPLVDKTIYSVYLIAGREMFIVSRSEDKHAAIAEAKEVVNSWAKTLERHK